MEEVEILTVCYMKEVCPFIKPSSVRLLSESCPLSSTTFPHILPLLSLLEKSVAVGEGTEPWETVEVGVDVVMFHLGAARTIAQLGSIYCSNAESRLHGETRGSGLWCTAVLSLPSC